MMYSSVVLKPVALLLSPRVPVAGAAASPAAAAAAAPVAVAVVWWARLQQHLLAQPVCCQGTQQLQPDGAQQGQVH